MKQVKFFTGVSTKLINNIKFREGELMIYVTRLNDKTFAINPDLIEMMEETPDTVITLTGGNKFVVSESIEVLIERIAVFRQRCLQICKVKE